MGTELARTAGGPRPFSLADDPFLRALHRLHLTRRDGSPRAWAIVAIAWMPLLVSALLRVGVGQRPSPILHDLSAHVRLLIGIPLLIEAERLLEPRCQAVIDQLYRGRLAEPAALDRIVERAGRLRDARLVELALLAIVGLGGLAVVWGHVGPTGLFSGISEAGSISFARAWYVLVALPITQFLMLRWLWHWGIWSYVEVRVARLPLATIATHPDRAAGLGFLATPLAAFAGFVLAIAATMAAAWGTKILDGQATLPTLVPSFLGFVVLALMVACGPLLLFIRPLYRARLRELPRYHGLALDFVRTFHRKWIEGRPAGEPLVSTPDLSAWNDLCGAYGSLVQVRLVPFGPRAVIGIVIAAVIPMLPLVAMTMPLTELLAKIARALLGGLPP